MRKLLARLFSPELSQLNADLAIANSKADFWEAFARDLEAKLELERKANRAREDLLLNAALHGHGFDGVPTREAVIEAIENGPQDTTGLDPDILKVLEERAVEMAEAEFGENPTDDQIAYCLDQMKKNPEYYASN